MDDQHTTCHIEVWGNLAVGQSKPDEAKTHAQSSYHVCKIVPFPCNTNHHCKRKIYSNRSPRTSTFGALGPKQEQKVINDLLVLLGNGLASIHKHCLIHKGL